MDTAVTVLRDKQKYRDFFNNNCINDIKVTTELTILDCDSVFYLIGADHMIVCKFKKLVPVIVVIEYMLLRYQSYHIYSEPKQNVYMNIDKLTDKYPYIYKYIDTRQNISMVRGLIHGERDPERPRDEQISRGSPGVQNTMGACINTNIQHTTTQLPPAIEIDDNTDYKDDVTCGICFTNKVNICFTPCGHTVCSTCVTQIDKCHKCREKITNKIKLFI